jgi:hypothetical protein
MSQNNSNSITINIPANASLTINSNNQVAWNGQQSLTAGTCIGNQAIQQSQAQQSYQVLSGDISGNYPTASGNCSIAGGYYNGNYLNDQTYGGLNGQTSISSGSIVIGGQTSIGTAIGTSGYGVVGGGLTIGTTGYPYTQTVGVVGGGWTAGGDLVGIYGSQYSNTYQYSIPATDLSVDTAIKAGDYNSLATMGNSAMMVDRRLFNKIAKAIVASNSFGHIANFILRTTNVDMKHYTGKMLRAFQESSEDNKEDTLSSYVSSFLYRFNVKEYVRFGIQQKSHKLLNAIISNLLGGIYGYSNGNFVNNNYINGVYNVSNVMPQPTPYSEKTFRHMYGAKYQDFEKVMCLSDNENILYSLFIAPVETNKQNLYRRVRQLGKIELATKMIDESKEKWAEALRNMK